MIFLLSLLVIGLVVTAFILLSRVQVLERRVARLEFSPIDTRVATAVPTEPAPAEAEPHPPARVISVAPAKAGASAFVSPPPSAMPPEAPAFAGTTNESEPVGQTTTLTETFESLVGDRLPIWIGGAALVLSGFFLVRYSIEAGLLGPQARAIIAALFGLVLIAASEWARRSPRTADDPRVGQSLAGAGIASLYGTLYMAGELYGLIGGGTAFVLLLLVTAGALALSIRHGPPTAIMGLIGGFAAPLVTGYSENNLAPLLIYLALFTAALFGLAIARGWAWLALAAAGAGFAWSGWLIAAIDGSAAGAIGPFVLVLAIGAAFALPRLGERGNVLVRAAPLVLGLVQLLMLAPRLDFGPLAWALYAMLAAATITLAVRDSRLVTAAGAAGILALLMLAIGLNTGSPTAPIAAAVFALLFTGAGQALLIREPGRPTWTALALGGSAGPFLLARALWADPVSDGVWALLAMLAAASCAVVAWRCRTLLLPLPFRGVSSEIGSVGSPGPDLSNAGGIRNPIAADTGRGEGPVRASVTSEEKNSPSTSSGQTGEGEFDTPTPFGLSLSKPRSSSSAPSNTPGHAIAPALTAILLAIGLSPLVGPAWTPLLIALLMLALAAWARHTASDRLYLLPAIAWAAILIAAARPLADYLFVLGGSLTGTRTHMAALPGLADAMRALAIPSALAAALLFDPRQYRRARAIVAGGVTAIAIFLAYHFAKLPLGIATPEAFLAWGFTERALITQGLFAIAFALATRPGWTRIAALVAALAVARIFWFDLALLNPLWVEQQVGALPILNAAVLHAAAATIWLWLLARRLPASKTWRTLALAACVLTALAIVRQASHGTVLTGDFGQGETWSYSAALLAVSIAWLARGIITGARDLRIAGLALLTLTTVKVFLIDAAALAGILRILSFLGLGLALIAIGWAYGKVLKRPEAGHNDPPAGPAPASAPPAPIV